MKVIMSWLLMMIEMLIRPANTALDLHSACVSVSDQDQAIAILAFLAPQRKSSPYFVVKLAAGPAKVGHLSDPHQPLRTRRLLTGERAPARKPAKLGHAWTK